MIDLKKPITTRDGREVRIYCVEHNSLRPVHGAMRKPCGPWVATDWFEDGAYTATGTGPEDLINPPARIRRTVWINVYQPHLYGGVYDSREKADRCALNAGNLDRRIACVRVEIDCAEGEGL